MNHIELGKRNEGLAAAYLERQGHRILDRNWRSGRKELDIVSETGDFIVVTEVRTIFAGNSGRPEYAVNSRKQKNIIQAAQAYLWVHRLHKPVRFDVVLIAMEGGDARISHIEDAFYPYI